MTPEKLSDFSAESTEIGKKGLRVIALAKGKLSVLLSIQQKHIGIYFLIYYSLFVKIFSDI